MTNENKFEVWRSGLLQVIKKVDNEMVQRTNFGKTHPNNEIN